MSNNVGVRGVRVRVYYCSTYYKAVRDGTREEPGTLTQGGALFSLVPLVWESNPKLQGGWCKPTTSPGTREVCVYYCSTYYKAVRVCSRGWGCVCVFYYCRTYYKAVRVGGGGEWRTCAMRDDEPRPVWMSLPITH